MKLFSRANPARDQARGDLDATLASVATGDLASADRLPVLWQASKLKPAEIQQRTRATLEQLADVFLADEVVTQDEEQRFVTAAGALGWDAAALGAQVPDIVNRLYVAVINGGRLPEADASDYSFMPRKGERVHMVIRATLMKDEAIKEWRGGSHGMSFRIAKGVTYRTGRSRGQMVVIGTRLVAEDAGDLALTSARAVFAGNRKTLEFAYPKLVSMEVFNDGLRLGVSNRQAASLFKLPSGDVAAAMINAAVQRL